MGVVGGDRARDELGNMRTAPPRLRQQGWLPWVRSLASPGEGSDCRHREKLSRDECGERVAGEAQHNGATDIAEEDRAAGSQGKSVRQGLPASAGHCVRKDIGGTT